MRLLEVHRARSIRNVTAFEEELFCDDVGWTRWLVLELPLKYEAKYRGSITLDEVLMHRDTFVRARRYNNMTSYIKAYVWAIEEGEDTRFHLHVILFCLPVTKEDERLANQIGGYWSDVVTSQVVRSELKLKVIGANPPVGGAASKSYKQPKYVSGCIRE